MAARFRDFACAALGAAASDRQVVEVAVALKIFAVHNLCRLTCQENVVPFDNTKKMWP